MESIERSKAVIALGKRLVKSLAKENDLTAEWMAHLIAERMDAIEHASPAEKAAAEEACANAIYELWSHRFSAPKGVNLLHQAEPIARALASLDPERKEFRFFSEAMGFARAEDLKNPNDWLKLAQQLDRTCKDLIHFALQKGADDGMTSQEFKDLLKQVLDAEADVHFEVRLVNFILDKNQEKVDEQEKLSRLAERIRWEKATRLEQFAALATNLARQLKEGLTEEPPKERPESFLEL
nr:hypothetical protein [uncultured Rhodoferax sp.]